MTRAYRRKRRRCTGRDGERCRRKVNSSTDRARREPISPGYGEPDNEALARRRPGPVCRPRQPGSPSRQTQARLVAPGGHHRRPMPASLPETRRPWSSRFPTPVTTAWPERPPRSRPCCEWTTRPWTCAPRGSTTAAAATRRGSGRCSTTRRPGARPEPLGRGGAAGGDAAPGGCPGGAGGHHGQRGQRAHRSPQNQHQRAARPRRCTTASPTPGWPGPTGCACSASRPPSTA